MENLPQNVINKIMFYLSHPVADLIKNETIFKFMALRCNEEKRNNGYCPFMRGYTDTRHTNAGVDPRKCTVDKYGRIEIITELTEQERDEYFIGYIHANRQFEYAFGVKITWTIIENPLLYSESNTDSDSYSDTVSDSDSD
jgi:hypothetical protein